MMYCNGQRTLNGCLKLAQTGKLLQTKIPDAVEHLRRESVDNEWVPSRFPEKCCKWLEGKYVFTEEKKWPYSFFMFTESLPASPGLASQIHALNLDPMMSTQTKNKKFISN